MLCGPLRILAAYATVSDGYWLSTPSGWEYFAVYHLMILSCSSLSIIISYLLFYIKIPSFVDLYKWVAFWGEI